MELFSNSYSALFLIIVLGYLLGRIKVKGVSLGVSAVIFVALIFGHYGVTIPQDFQYLGLVLFIFTIGIQAGPGFFESFSKHGRQLVILATVLVVSGGVVAYLIYFFSGIDMNICMGLLTGALTSTPGLAVAIDASGSHVSSIGYSIAYPFGVIGVILFVSFLPKFLHKNIKDAEEQYRAERNAAFEAIESSNFVVKNENVIGKTLSELRIRFMTKAVISRVMYEKVAITPSRDTVLNKGAIVKAVGTKEALERVRLLIGPKTEEEIPLSKKYEIRSFLVTNEEVVKKRLGELNLSRTYNATVTRIMRSGVQLSSRPALKLLFGDKVIVAAHKENLKQISRIFGDDDKKLSATDFFPISVGIILGILASKVSLNVGSFSFKPGLAGGMLIMALILGRLGKTGPIMWTMTGASNQLLRQLGLLFFLSAVGTHAGLDLASTFQKYGIELFFYGFLITIIPLVLTSLVAQYFIKMNLLVLLGTLTGSMTSTPGLATVNNMSDTDAAAIAYVTVYPVAMVLLIVVVQVLSML